MQIIIMALVSLLLIGGQALLYRRYWDRGLSIDIRFSTDHAVEGDKLYLTEVITNLKALPLPWLQAKFQISTNLRFDAETHMAVSDDNYKSELFQVGAFQRVTRTHHFICAQRGLYPLRHITLTAQDLLMMRRHSCEHACRGYLIVYPAAIPYDALSPAFRMVMGSVRTRRFINPDPFEFRGIRDYEPADSLRMINHKATAKSSSLMVNVYAPTTTQNVTVWLNTQDYAARPLPRVYESAIRLAATFAGQLLSEGLSLAFKSNAKSIVSQNTRIDVPSGAGLPHLSSVLESLALLDLTAAPEDMPALLREEASPEDVHILISSYDGDDVQQAVTALRERGAEVHWILPLTNDIRTRVKESPQCHFWYV